MNTPKSAPLPTTGVISRIVLAGSWLIKPSDKIKSVEDQRRSQLLAGVMLTAAVIGGLIIAIVLGLDPNDIHDSGVEGGIVSIVLIAILYFVNRLGYFQWAASAFVVIISILFVAPPYLGKGADFLSFAIIPVLIAGMLFSFRGSFIVAVLLIITVFVLNTVTATGIKNLTPELNVKLSSLRQFWYFLMLASGMILVFIRHLASLESIRRQMLEETNQKLRDSELLLEKRVIQRTHDLELAREQAEESRKEAEQANFVKSAFLASMSHELRTPLNAIINFTTFVAQGITGPITERQSGLLNQVLNSGNHLLNLINDVLDMSKIESGSLVLFVEDNVDLVTLVNNVHSTAQGLLSGKPIELTVDLPPDALLVRGDRQRIYQVMLNIVSNACKFTKEGLIQITLGHDADTVTFSVKDSGPGIPPEDHAKVFESFKQTETGLRQGGGTGLGMPISKSLIDAHQGRLWIESEVGHGATFLFTIPIKSEALTPTV